MKIHVYTDIHPLFGAGAMVWVKALMAAGHDVDYIDMGQFTHGALPDAGPCDVNILVAGIFAFERFQKVGLPAHGRHVFWLLDPLTRDAASSHQFKAGLFDALAPQVSAVAAMDDAIAGYLRQHFPALPVQTLPYLVAPTAIKPPLAEAQRTIDVLWIGSDNPRRRRAAKLFEDAGIDARFVWASVWGAERDRLRRESRIVLNIQADGQHRYFDQFRAFETWAAGSVVVAEQSADLPAMGVMPGTHLAVAPLEDLPELCRGLLADPQRRESMTSASQALLRETFTPAARYDEMLMLVARAASAPTP